MLKKEIIHELKLMKKNFESTMTSKVIPSKEPDQVAIDGFNLAIKFALEELNDLLKRI